MPNFTVGGTCCTTGGTFDGTDGCAADCIGLNDAFCASGANGANPTDVANRLFREFLIPADATNCPGQVA